jgi:NAD(P)-dependent dehydrogenase (short-subunit alcohol dehydrogenase family)
MKTIVITGSTRGIGYGLADAFLARKCNVVISGRTQRAVDHAIINLKKQYPKDQIAGCPCDVTDSQQVQDLWDAAQSCYGQVDIWINNAGISGERKKIWENSAENAHAVIDTNVSGAIHGSQIAIRGMLVQGFGALYNMEGMGSDGRTHDGLGLYGTSKYALKYLTDALVLETKGSPLIIGALRPGMVITELVTDQYAKQPEELDKVKGIFNIIADTVDNVAPWFADQILKNRKTGVRIKYTSMWKLVGRLLSSPFNKRDLFGDLDIS